MDKYLIALDMDGTLLNKKKKISYKTKKYLQKLAKKGHIIVLTSGRPIRSLLPYYKTLRLNTPVVCYNGAYVFSPNDPSVPTTIFELNQKTIKNIYKDVKPYIFNVMAETPNEIFLDKEDEYLDKFFYFKGMKINKGEFFKILNQNTMTYINKYSGNKEDEIKVREILAKYKEFDVCFWTNSPYFEFSCKGVSKGSSIGLIAEYYNISKDHIIAFGDAQNDVELFKHAKISVAMKNGSNDLKKDATLVSIKDNNHNGIYYTLKNLISS